MALFNRIINLRVSGNFVAIASVAALRNGADWKIGADGPGTLVRAVEQPTATYLSERHPSQYPMLTKPMGYDADACCDEQEHCCDPADQWQEQLSQQLATAERRSVESERLGDRSAALFAEHTTMRNGWLGCSTGVSDSRSVGKSPSLTDLEPSTHRRAWFTQTWPVTMLSTLAESMGCVATQTGKRLISPISPTSSAASLSAHIRGLDELGLGMGARGGRIPPFDRAWKRGMSGSSAGGV